MTTADLASLSDDALLQACIQAIRAVDHVDRERDPVAWQQAQQVCSRLWVECNRDRRPEGLWVQACERVHQERWAAQAQTRQDLDALRATMKRREE